MFLSSLHELKVLFGTFAGGIVLGLVFDFFRIIRKNFRLTSFVWLQDVVMWMIMLAVVCATVFITNNGKIRWYEFVGFGLGVAIYIALLSSFVIGVSSVLIGIFKKAVMFVFGVFLFPFKFIAKLFCKPIVRVYRFYHQKIYKFFKIHRVLKKI